MAEADPHKTLEQKTFNLHEAKTHLSRLVNRARAGEEIVIAKAGQPWAKLVSAVPSDVPKQRTPGGLTLTGPIDWDAFNEPLPEEDLAYIDDRPEHERR